MFFLLGLLFAGIVAGDKFGCSDPSGWIGTIDHIDIEGCEVGKKPCKLVRGQDANLSLHFTTKKDIEDKSFKPKVHGLVAGIPIPYQTPETNACVNSNITCPVHAGSSVGYKGIFPILDIYPTIPVQIRWQLMYGDEVVVCAIIRAQIVDC